MSILDDEAFTLVDGASGHIHPVYDDFRAFQSGKLANPDILIQHALRRHYPHHVLTVIPNYNVDLLAFAAAGNAHAELDDSTEYVLRLRHYIRTGFRIQHGMLADAVSFAKYEYTWLSEKFILYFARVGVMANNYVLKEASEGETVNSHSRITDALIKAIGESLKPSQEVVYVFDGYWTASHQLWQEVQMAGWDKVILNDDMKKALTEIVQRFFDSKDVYDDLGVPWKRGVIFHGPPGNGKTISIKALMHTLYSREVAVPTLYVRHAPTTNHIARVFAFARAMVPCLLVFEDIETIVTSSTRSYFFNEVDGLSKNDGIMMVASTNYLDRLDPGLSKRPSRFDRKYLFPLPAKEERTLYCSFWREKLRAKPTIKFPKRLCSAIAGITDGFSFAFMQEAFIATLLTMARNRTDSTGSGPDDGDDGEDGDLDDYELWRVMKQEVAALREDMGNLLPSVAETDMHADHEPGAKRLPLPKLAGCQTMVEPHSGDGSFGSPIGQPGTHVAPTFYPDGAFASPNQGLGVPDCVQGLPRGDGGFPFDLGAMSMKSRDLRP